MTYQPILNQVQEAVFQAFAAVPKKEYLWVHNFSHMTRVAANARRLLETEALKLAPKMNLAPQKFAFLVELSAWLHDLGRTMETKSSFWGGRFNHAVESEKMGRKILLEDRLLKIESRGREWRIEDREKKYKKESIFNFLPSTPIFHHLSSTVKYEDIELVLQAVAEHNQPTPAHPENLITRLLQDADRGDGFSYQGIIMVLNYNGVISTPQIEDETTSRRTFLRLLPGLAADRQKRRQTSHWLTYLSIWYTGGWALNKNGDFRHCEPRIYAERGNLRDCFILDYARPRNDSNNDQNKVCSLYTQTAKKIYRPGYQLIQKYLKMLQKTENREEPIIKNQKSKIKNQN